MIYKAVNNLNILITVLGIEFKLVLLPRRLALIEPVPFEPGPPSRSRSKALCVEISSEPYKLSAISGKCLRNSQKFLQKKKINKKKCIILNTHKTTATNSPSLPSTVLSSYAVRIRNALFQCLPQIKRILFHSSRWPFFQ